MDKKCKSKLIRFGEKDLEIIREKAEKANLKVGTYIRQISVEGEVRAFDLAVLINLEFELSRIGTNINQVALVVNSTKQVYKNDIQKIQEEFEKLENSVNRAFDIFTRQDRL